MRQAEQVVFGGGWTGADALPGAEQARLDRDAAVRNDPVRIAAALDEPSARVLPMWRGKPLVAGAAADRLGWVAPGSAVLARATEAPIYLGRLRGAPQFAADISAWEPAGLDPAVLGGFSDDSLQQHPAAPADHLFRELRAVMTRLDPAEAEIAATARALFNWHRSHGFCARCGQPSQVVAAGWQRACASCGAQHFPRTDPVVIMLVTRGNRVLLGRSPAFPERMYSLLAGFVEPGETVEAAVRREVLEETGIRVGAVRYLASQPWPFPASLMLGCAGEALEDKIAIDPAELADARWATREEVLEAFAGGGDFQPARPGAIAHFLLTAWVADRLD